MGLRNEVENHLHAARSSGRLDTVGAPIVLFVALAYGVYAQGAFYRGRFQLFVGLVGVAGSLVALFAARLLVRAAVVAVPLAGAIVLGELRSGGWTSEASAASSCLAAVVVAWTIGASVGPQKRRVLQQGYLGLAVIVAFTAWVGVVHHVTPWGRPIGEIWRGSSSITYANAAAAMIVPGVLVGLVEATQAGALWQRRLQHVVTVMLIVGLIATGSRAGWLTLASGFVALVLLTPSSHRQPLVWRPFVVGVGAAPATVFVVLRADAASSVNPLFGWMLLACGGVWIWWRVARRGGVRRWSPAAAAMVSAFGMTGLAFGSWVGLRATPSVANRLETEAIADRWDEWGAAWSVFVDAPLTGAGIGRAPFAFVRDGTNYTAEFAHNEYLEVLAELGVVGLIGVAVVISAGMYCLRPWQPVRGPADATAAIRLAFVVFLVHSGLDFLWHVPVVPVAMALLVGTASKSWCTAEQHSARDPAPINR